jgi:hypothetical protein
MTGASSSHRSTSRSTIATLICGSSIGGMRAVRLIGNLRDNALPSAGTTGTWPAVLQEVVVPEAVVGTPTRQVLVTRARGDAPAPRPAA